MVELKIGNRFNKTKVLRYSSFKEMPNSRYQEFTKIAMRAIGIGSTIEDFNAHFAKLHGYLMNGQSSDAMKEMKNVFINFFYNINKIDVNSYCLAPFIHSVDGIEYTGTEIEDHREMLNYLWDKGLTSEQCEDSIFEVKKKLLANWPNTFLPDIVVREMKMY